MREPTWPHVPLRTKVIAWIGYVIITWIIAGMILENFWIYLLFCAFSSFLVVLGLHIENDQRAPKKEDE